MNCAAPLRLGVSALGICFDSYPKKILCILYIEFLLDFFYSSKIAQFLHVKWVAVTPRTLEIAFFGLKWKLRALSTFYIIKVLS